MNSLSISLKAVLPFVIYLGLGVFLRKYKDIDEAFFKKLNHIIFSVLFPFTMFHNIHNMSLDMYGYAHLVLVCLVTLFLLVGFSFVVVCGWVKENKRRGVIIQALYRSNTLLYALPLTESLFGNDGLSLASVLIAFFVPIYNILAIIILEYFNGQSSDIKNCLKKSSVILCFKGQLWV